MLFNPILQLLLFVCTHILMTLFQFYNHCQIVNVGKRSLWKLLSFLQHHNQDNLNQNQHVYRGQTQQNSHLLNQLEKKNEEISFYQDSLEIIKREMQQLNQTIVHKTTQYFTISEELEAIKQINLYNQKQKNNLALALGKISQDVNQLLHNISEIEGSCNPKVNKQTPHPLGSQLYDLILHLVRSVDEQRKATFYGSQSLRKEYLEKLRRQTEKSIKLEFELKLMEERRQDEEKQLEVKRGDEKDRLIEELELRCMRVEQESQRRLQDLSQERNLMQSRLVEESSEKQNSMSVHVQSLTRRLRELEKDKKQLKGQLDRVREKYRMLNQKYTKLNIEQTHTQCSDEYLEFMRTLRQYEQEKKIMQIRMEELAFRNKTLVSELQLYK